MFYTYVLHSARDGEWYTGATSDLRARVGDHIQGRVRSTRNRAPLDLVYYEACLSQADAFRRERYLKTGKGKRYLRQRLREWLAASEGPSGGGAYRVALGASTAISLRSRLASLSPNKLERH